MGPELWRLLLHSAGVLALSVGCLRLAHGARGKRLVQRSPTVTTKGCGEHMSQRMRDWQQFTYRSCRVIDLVTVIENGVRSVTHRALSKSTWLFVPALFVWWSHVGRGGCPCPSVLVDIPPPSTPGHSGHWRAARMACSPAKALILSQGGWAWGSGLCGGGRVDVVRRSP